MTFEKPETFDQWLEEWVSNIQRRLDFHQRQVDVLKQALEDSEIIQATHKNYQVPGYPYTVRSSDEHKDAEENAK